MADDPVDPCECVWQHELSMRRLLSLLRQVQAYCTSAECVEAGPGPLALPQRAPSAADCAAQFVTVFALLALAVALYVMRPRRAAAAASDQLADKPARRRDQDGDGGAPPNPPQFG